MPMPPAPFITHRKFTNLEYVGKTYSDPKMGREGSDQNSHFSVSFVTWGKSFSLRVTIASHTPHTEAGPEIPSILKL